MWWWSLSHGSCLRGKLGTSKNNIIKCNIFCTRTIELPYGYLPTRMQTRFICVASKLFAYSWKIYASKISKAATLCVKKSTDAVNNKYLTLIIIPCYYGTFETFTLIHSAKLRSTVVSTGCVHISHTKHAYDFARKWRWRWKPQKPLHGGSQ